MTTSFFLAGKIRNGEPLSHAELRTVRDDVREVLSHAIPEVPALIAALCEGRVNGKAYGGECACLVGTLANARGCSFRQLPGIEPNVSRPAEAWFRAIRPGDTPATSQVAALAVEWAEEFLAEQKEGGRS